MTTWRPRSCRDCGDEYQPTSGRGFRCPDCVANHELELQAEKDARAARGRKQQDMFAPLSGYDGIAKAVICVAVQDLHRQYTSRNHVSDITRLEAREWLSTTGRDWMQIAGWDVRMLDAVLEAR